MQAPAPIDTLTQFMESSDTRMSIYDMGRRVQRIERDAFIRFERCETPYPLPLQQQAWLGLLFEDSTGGIEPFIWFLRFPLDEQAKLLQAARDDFLHRLMERIGEKLSPGDSGEILDAALEDNPYTFKPKDERMAVFHAKISLQLSRPVSQFYAPALDYLEGSQGWEQWQSVGYQGLAEIAVRHQDEQIDRIINSALMQLPAPPFIALCHCLENLALGEGLVRTLQTRTRSLLADPDTEPATLSAAIRAPAMSQPESLKRESYSLVLDDGRSRAAEILAAVSGRGWEALHDRNLRRQFLERLAENDAGQDFFNQCLGDLLFIPGMRQPLLEGMRDTERSDQLSRAIGALFQGLTG